MLQFGNGDKYVGDFHENVFHGKGSMHSETNKYNYNGDFVNGVAIGKGVVKCQMYCYEGDIVNGELEGNGKIEFNNKDIYVGSFVQSRPNGYGVYTQSEGNKVLNSVANWLFQGRNWQ
jgi:hypothetical protein